MPSKPSTKPSYARTGTRLLLALAMATLLATTVGTAVTAPSATAQAELEEITDFGPNPANIQMFIYVPDQLADPAPVVVDMHGCGGTAAGHLRTSGMRAQAAEHGFIQVLPEDTGSCWNASSAPSIVSMVEWTMSNYSVDDSSVFASGMSAGGYMTNQMVGGYADIFAAGSSWSGTSYGCNLVICALGFTQRTPQQWADAVRDANPGHDGPWPRMQIWHGTSDFVVRPVNANEQMEQWTEVNGASQTPTSETTLPNGVTQRDYTADGRTVVEWFEFSGGHTIRSEAAAEAVRFFGID